MPWIVIDKDKPLKPGDIVELDFRILSGLWLSSTEIAMIEWQLADRDDWEIISNTLPEAGKITFTVRVKDYPPEGSWLQSPGASGFVVTGTVVAVTAAKIAAAICLVGLVMSLAFVCARQFVEIVPETFERLGETTGGKIGMVVIGLLAFTYLRKYLKL